MEPPEQTQLLGLIRQSVETLEVAAVLLLAERLVPREHLRFSLTPLLLEMATQAASVDLTQATHPLLIC
jgi:hypothetical protein